MSDVLEIFLYTLLCNSMKDQVGNIKIGLFRCTTTCSPKGHIKKRLIIYQQ